MKFDYLKSTIVAIVLLAIPAKFYTQHICGLQGYDVCCEGLQAIDEDQFTFIPPPAGFVYNEARDVVISVTYNNFNATQMAAFDYAVDIWASNLTSSVPVLINATMSPLGGSTLGFAGPITIDRNFPGSVPNRWYPQALANKLAGSDQVVTQMDITCTFNSNTNWYYGTDGNTPGGQYDFVSVVLHELGHGLGFIGSGDVVGSLGYIGQAGDPFIYDSFVEENNGTSILVYSNGSVALGNALTSNQLYWNGTFGMNNNGGTRPRLYAPGSWNDGSSFSHLNEGTYPSGNANSLMTPFLGSAEAIHDPGPICYGMFEDMGWDVGGCVITDVTAGAQFPCNTSTGAYTQQIFVTYENPPGSGFLVVNGNSYPITFSPQLVNLLNQPADGLTQDVEVSFTQILDCTFSAPGLYQAPNNCCAIPRMVTVDTDINEITFQNFGSCPVDLSQHVLSGAGMSVTLGSLSIVSGSLNLNSGQSVTVSWPSWSPAPGGDALCFYFPEPDTMDPDDLADFVQWSSAGHGCETLADTKGIWMAGTYVGDLSPYTYNGNGSQNGSQYWDGYIPPPECNILGIVSFPGPCDPATNTYDLATQISWENAPGTGTIVINGVSQPYGTSPQFFLVPGLPADGQLADVTAYFSDDPTCTLTVTNAYTAPDPCSIPCDTDLNGDFEINVQDLLIYLADIGCIGICVGDFDGDGTVDTGDLLIFLPTFGQTCQ